MQIALTADLHLRRKEDHPERYHALNDIMSQMVNTKIEVLIIAGDLFDVSLRNFNEFEDLCNNEKFRDLKIHIIPGNHDPSISTSSIVSDNIEIYSKTSIFKIEGEKTSILFLPYSEGNSMGEKIEEFSDQLDSHNWVLVSHGDWMEGLKEPNPYENGIYMPLTSKDIQRYQPKRVFLGHIHIPTDMERVHYIGSPCGIDITETGERRFLIYDTDTDQYEEKKVNNNQIFFNETIFLLPVEDEVEYITQAVKDMIEKWGISKSERDKVHLRVEVKGYCSDKKRAAKIIRDYLKGYHFYKGKEPDLSNVLLSNDYDLQHIANRVSERIKELEWNIKPEEPTGQDILEKALEIIYGE